VCLGFVNVSTLTRGWASAIANIEELKLDACMIQEGMNPLESREAVRKITNSYKYTIQFGKREGL